MPTLAEETTRAYCLQQENLKRWQTLRASLPPKSRLRRYVERNIAAVEQEYRAAERRLFDVFDITATDLMTADGILPPEGQRELLVDLADHHARWSREVPAPEHADMHRRLARQLGAFIDERYNSDEI